MSASTQKGLLDTVSDFINGLVAELSGNAPVAPKPQVQTPAEIKPLEPIAPIMTTTPPNDTGKDPSLFLPINYAAETQPAQPASGNGLVNNGTAPTPTPEPAQTPAQSKDVSIWGERTGDVNADGLTVYVAPRLPIETISNSTLSINPANSWEVEMKNRFMQGARPTNEQIMKWNSYDNKSPKYTGSVGEGL